MAFEFLNGFKKSFDIEEYKTPAIIGGAVVLGLLLLPTLLKLTAFFAFAFVATLGVMAAVSCAKPDMVARFIGS